MRGARSNESSVLGLVSWALYDWANSAFPTLIQTFLFAAYFLRQVVKDEKLGTNYWGNAMGVAGFVIAILGPLLGAVTDQTGRRKPWIAGFTVLSVGATALLWFIQPSTNFILPALALVIVGTIGAELAVVFYNSMLPAIVSEERIGRWSGWGWGLGYAGGLACLTVALIGFVRAENPWFGVSAESGGRIRAATLLVAVWYSVFSIPMFLWTPDEPRSDKRWLEAFRDGRRQLWDSIRHARQHAQIFRFLVAHMIFIDGLTTMFIFGGVFTAGTFQMNEQQVLLFGITINVTSGIGAAAFAFLDDRLGGKRTILVSLLGLIVAGTLMLLAPSATWFWILGLILGIFAGPAQSASRSYLARVSPKELRNQMFGLFALSGKATAFVGPLLVAWITYATGSQHIGMGTIILFFAVGLILMLTVASDKAKKSD
jgi:UMF1 family MFS transporter